MVDEMYAADVAKVDSIVADGFVDDDDGDADEDCDADEHA